MEHTGTKSILELNLEAVSRWRPELHELLAGEALPAEVPPLYGPDPELAERLIAGAAVEEAHHFVYVGVRGGAPKFFFDRLQKKRLHYIMVESPLELISAFSLVDFRETIEAENVFFLTGADAVKKLETLLGERPGLGINCGVTVVFCLEDGRSDEFQEMKGRVAAVVERIRAAQIENCVRICNTCRAPEMEEVEAKYRRGEPLRILFGVCDNTVFLKYAMADIIAAARTLGHETAEMHDGKEGFYTTPLLLGAAENFRPDLVFLHGNTSTANIAFNFNQLRQTQVHWFFDNPRYFLTAESVKELAPPHVVVAGLLKSFADELKALGYEKPVHTVGIGINENVFSPGAAPPEMREKSGHDAVYVGNIRSVEALCAALGSEDMADYILEFLRHIWEKIDVLFTPGQAVESFLSSRGASPEAARRENVYDWYFNTAAQLLREVNRLAFLGAVKDLGLNVYGGGWEHYPELGRRRGFIENGPELAALYGCSKVTIHLHELTAAHPRVLECLASGGFVLARRLPPGPNDEDFLEEGREIATFTTRADLRGKLELYLSHPEERAEITRAGRARVLRGFTYAARLKKLLDAVFAG